MPGRRGLNEGEIKSLRTLERAVAEGGGWRRGGVRGWLLGSQVNASCGSSVGSLYLPRLRGLGLVSGEPVHDPGRRQARILWRITQVGADELARAEGREPARVDAPARDPLDERVVYIGAGAWACLAVLKARHPGWVRWRDVMAEARKRHGAWVYLSDVLVLTARALAEREDEGQGSGKVIWLRATTIAHATRLLDAAASESWVQLLLPPPPPAH